MAGDLVLLNDTKPLGWLACTIAELEGERNIGWLADTVVLLRKEDNFDWLPDDMALLTNENKLVWLHDDIVAREERNKLGWVTDDAAVNLDWLSRNVVFENENNLGWFSDDIVLSVVPEDADILGNKGNWLTCWWCCSAYEYTWYNSHCRYGVWKWIVKWFATWKCRNAWKWRCWWCYRLMMLQVPWNLAGCLKM